MASSSSLGEKINLALKCMKQGTFSESRIEEMDDLQFRLHFIFNQWWKTSCSSSLNWTLLQDTLENAIVDIHHLPKNWFTSMVKQPILSMVKLKQSQSSFISDILNASRLKNIEYEIENGIIYLTITTDRQQTIAMDKQEYHKLRYQLAKALQEMKRVEDHPILLNL